METSTYRPPQMSNNQPDNTPKEPSKALKIIVLIILIALLIIGIILPIKLVPDAFSSISNTVSSWFGTSKVVLSTNPSAIQSGSPFTLSWTGPHKDTGSYSISYSCAAGVSIQMTFGGSPVNVPCGSVYYFSSNQNSVSLTPISTMQRYTDITLTLGYLEAASSSPTTLGTLLISIENPKASGIASATSTTSSTHTATTTAPVKQPTYPTPTIKVPAAPTPAPVPAPTPAPAPAKAPAPVSITRTHRVSNPYGTTDLSVRIIATGYMTDSARFVAAPSIQTGMRAAFEFVVTNQGDKASGPWNFTANLPTVYHPTYSAYNLPALGPGDSVAYVLGFDDINPGYSNPVSITVSTTGDTSASNDSSTASISQY